MTADEVERLAREAGLVQYAGNWCSDQADGIEPNELARFAALVQAAERARWQAVLRAIAGTPAQGSGGPGSHGWKHWAVQAEEATRAD